ncbi:MAG: endonuclease MutS2 [Syntrophomonadaceae bacterium]|nr:endonuclease MutS2 [Syntrophomonadaceae bacterium]
MNEKTLNKLEYDKIKAQLAELTYFEGGRSLVEEMKPSTDFIRVIASLDETAEAMEALRFNEPGFLSGLKLVNNYLSKVKVGGLLLPSELLDIYRILNSSRRAKKLFGESKYPRLRVICSDIKEDLGLERKIHDAVGEDGELRDDASAQLKTLRNQINTMRIRIRNYLQDFIRSPENQKKLQDALVTERDGRYVVPVKQEFRHEVKGIIHDESASGATVFIEPLPVVENNNRIRSLQAEEKREVERILRDLSQAVAVFTAEIAVNQNILSDLDLIYARARMAYKTNSYRPEINNAGIVDISRALHPLLGESGVPVDVQLGKNFDILVITGPNTGGKTVTLKTIGLLTLMGMSGLFIPARENSRISIFKDIYVDIGDEQSIEQSLSTFSSHMKNIVEILHKADQDSLVLMDEVGAGTDPVEGAILARVILEELQRKKSRVVITTHQSELKNFAYQNERVENACVEFDPVSLLPTYKLTIGMPGQSNAFAIAARLGMQSELVQRARKLVPQREMEFGNMIRQLKESRSQFETSNREVDKLKEELRQEKMLLEEDKKNLLRERREVMEKARSEAEQHLRELKNEANSAIQELKQMLKEKEQPPKWHEVEKSRKKLNILSLDEFNDYSEQSNSEMSIRPGDYVYINNINQKGYVLDGPNSQGEVSVQVGMLKLNVNQKQLSLSQAPEEKRSKWRTQSYLEKARKISKEIDLRGETVEDAITLTDKYIDDASLVGLESVSIIHGKGTGALRAALRDFLKNHPHVKSLRDGLSQEGGSGVTVVELN